MGIRWMVGVAMVLASVLTSLPHGAANAGKGDEWASDHSVVVHISVAQAVRMLKSFGAEITRDETRPGKPVIRVILDQNLIGKPPKATDARLVYLTALTDLQEVSLLSGTVTDAGLAHLKALPALRRLNLAGTKVTDAGLAQLRKLPKLEWVDLGSTKVTAAGVASLKKALPKVTIDLEPLGQTGIERPAAVFEP